MSTAKLEKQTERLGSFFLGAEIDPDSHELSAPLHFDARDLTTHGVCVGMTGSGKTGLCVGLLEEAALDQVPAIIIDPKGDMGNLLLHFPELAAQDFLPWVNADDARRKGLSNEDFAQNVSTMWRSGLADWGIDAPRIRALSDSVNFQVFTPGSTSVRPVNVLGRLEGPQDASGDELHERSASIASALLGLIGLDADPSRSREFTFLTVLIEHLWSSGAVPDIAMLVRSIPDPPVRRFGVFDVDSFFPKSDRFEFAMRFNNLLASPSFGTWLEGQPLDIDSILFGEGGKPCHSIFYIAHLSDEERMFFVTLLLDNLVEWMRRQPGTTSLRALLYFDEIFGFLPPVANPPSKRSLMTILKQGRAFGLGALLATQNPVDLDYKALSNAGTWFIGRLQSEQDQNRLLNGLGSTVGASGSDVDLGSLIGQLDKREFLLHSVHESPPRVFRTRWAMNYLRGPLTRKQLASIQPRSEAPPAYSAASTPSAPPSHASALSNSNVARDFLTARPSLPLGVREAFLDLPQEVGLPSNRELEARLGVRANVRFLDRKYDVDTTEEELLLLGDNDTLADWAGASVVRPPFDLVPEARDTDRFSGDLPQVATTKQGVASAEKSVKEFLYRNRELKLKIVPLLELCQRPAESDEAFSARVQLAAREKRDDDLDRLVDAYEPKIERLEDRLRTKEFDIAEREAAVEGHKHEEWIRLGESVLGAVLGGRRPRLSGNASKRRMTASARKRLERALAEADDIRDDIADLKGEVEEKSREIRSQMDSVHASHETFEITPRRTDVSTDFVGVVWVAAPQTGGA